MNIYAIIILSTLVLGFLLDLISDKLNISALDPELPEEFKDVYSDESYSKSQTYTKVRTKFGLITSTVSLAEILIFWFVGGFNYLDQYVRQYTESEITAGLMFVGILILFNSILSLPFSIYSTFVVEEKLGFNKTTGKTFITDKLKAAGLSVMIGGPLLAGIIYILSTAGANAWLYGWAALTGFSLILQFIAPTWIMPLFNKFTPLEDAELRNSIMTYAKYVDFSLKNVYVIDGSKRSSKSNAFFTGFGKNKRIALYDTLIEKHTNKELLGILAHEIGHYKKKHIIKNMFVGFVHSGVLFYLLSFFLNKPELFEAFYMEETSIYAGLIFFGLLYTPVEMIISVFMSHSSRKNEYEADWFAAETTNAPDEMINALKKLSEHNLSNLTPHPFYVFINYSHPPVLQRITALRKFEPSAQE
ncbi:MAG: M48 family metallopeptidase [Candidatus Kapabacteria bacterium]|jgi:STE24 endopeptidase|nr:M48 family metallopeptidase [Candidatus Kapabacteria bacterium]